VSLRSKRPNIEYRYELIAEYIFAASLVGIMLIIILITFNFMK
jgi:hypothetical protein